jgi:hypothetical protein
MAIDPVGPVYTEVAAASTISQASLTRRDRELQVDEGRPPIEVVDAEFEALRWRKREDLREKWKKRREQRQARQNARGSALQDEREDAGAVQSEPARESAGSVEESAEESEEEESIGTFFDDRS